MEDKIVGTTMPVREIVLNPGEAIFAESGELSWMTTSIAMQTSTQYGGGGGVGGVLKRAVGGNSIFMTEYSSPGAPGMVAFAAKLPGQIFPIDVAPQPGMGYLGHRPRSSPRCMECSSPSDSNSASAPASLAATVFDSRRSPVRVAPGSSSPVRL